MHDHQAGASVIQDDPQLYVREVWHFQKADINLIRRVMNEFNWERTFFNLDIKEMLSVFNTTIKSIMANFIPHETIICDDDNHL